MRMLTRSIPLAALVACLGAAHLQAQQPSSGAFQWYVGGHGGVLSFQPRGQARTEAALGGADLLITAKRTALLLSVEHAFADDEPASYDIVQSVGGVMTAETVDLTFDYIRKYSATLLVFPVRAPISPYFGVGVGIIHTGGYDDSDPFELAHEFGSSGFGSLLGGLELRVSRLTAFGQYQVTTGSSRKTIVEEGVNPGDFTAASGRFLDGPTHTFSAGLRISLGSAREGYN